MSWSAIKKAINSTLGTKDFEPLDKLINKWFDKALEIKTKLESGNNEYVVEDARNAYAINYMSNKSVSNNRIQVSEYGIYLVQGIVSGALCSFVLNVPEGSASKIYSTPDPLYGRRYVFYENGFIEGYGVEQIVSYGFIKNGGNTIN